MKSQYKNFSFQKVPGQQEPMENYMKNHFPFVGVPAPERRKQTSEILKMSRKETLQDCCQLINNYYYREEREYQYLAIDLALENIKRFSFAEIEYISHLVSEKAWWDSVDHWRKMFAKYVGLHLDEKEKVFELFYGQIDFWMRRIAINLQLMEKETLDVNLLSKAILYDVETDEFFIQKAIGWSLRQYSKYNPDWVIAFINQYSLSPLAVREASKHLK